MTNYYPYDTSSSTTNWYDNDTSNTSNTPTWQYCRVIQRKVLIEIPGKWDEKANNAFVELVNIETKTGWIVELIIKGKIIITDPNVEKRTMKEFLPLLKWGANTQDTKTIMAFLEKYLI